MSEKLDLFKQRYPDYQNVPNAQLAHALWNAEYKDKMPMGIFADSLELADDEFGEMIGFASQSGYEPTTMSGGGVTPGARGATAARGFSMGAAENAAAALMATKDRVGRFVRGEEQKPFGEDFNDYLGLTRNLIEEYQKERPYEAFFMEMVPALASGIGVERAIAGGVPRVAMGTSPSVARTAATSGTAGGVYGFATGEPGERLESAFELAIPSAFFGGVSQIGLNFAAPAIRSIGRSFGKRMQQFDSNPTIEAARALKNDIYEKATNAGIVYDVSAMRSLYNKARRFVADEGTYSPEVDDQMTAALKMLKNYSRKPQNLIQLEKLRRAMYDRYRKSGYTDQTIRELTHIIDETIENFGSGDANIIQAARLANSRFKKAELINEAFDKAQRSAEAAGSGGNVINRYKQVINNILNNKKEMRFFTPEEERAMRNFVEFTTGEQLTRLGAKLDPTSGGLMAALAIGGALSDLGTTASIAVPASIARRGLEQTTTEGAEALVERMATGQTPTTRAVRTPSTVMPQLVEEYDRETERLRGDI